MKRYTAQLFLATAVFAGLLAALNWLMDPYWIFGTPEISRLNRGKVALEGKSRIFETHSVLTRRPQVLILGTSREDAGIDPQYPFFAGKAYNGAIVSQSYRETHLLLEALDRKGAFPKTVVLGLLFENANVYGKKAPDFDEANIRTERNIELLVSLETVKDSAITFLKNTLIRPTPEVSAWTWNGMLRPVTFDKSLKEGHRSRFLGNERHYLTNNYFPEPSCKQALEDPRTHYSLLSEIRGAMATAYKHDADMRMFFGPSHARQWETIAISGLWPMFDEWKRRLMRLNEEEAAKAGKQPFELWDFSGYNSVTTEPVPLPGDITTRMKYYYESSHYTPAAGDLVLDRMFGYHYPGREVPDDFGVQLSPSNLEAHLHHIRLERAVWRTSHPDDVAELENLAGDVARKKHCASNNDRLTAILGRNSK